jgi:hypothetical protein
MMESRNRLGVPVTMEEILEDLYEIMMNIKDNVVFSHIICIP